MPRCHILVSGAPCQSFSSAGKNQGIGDEGRGNLIYATLEYVVERKPRVVCIENVKVGKGSPDTFNKNTNSAVRVLALFFLYVGDKPSGAR